MTEQPAAVTAEFHLGNGWTIEVRDDLSHGFHWWATRLGVLWAHGWARTRQLEVAKIAAQRAALYVYERSENH
jgi:hypothetical protein